MHIDCGSICSEENILVKTPVWTELLKKVVVQFVPRER